MICSDKMPPGPVPSGQATLCAVCAWRKDCLKKFSYDQGGPVKCAEFTRDAGLPPEEPS